jgi:hypothetical protein
MMNPNSIARARSVDILAVATRYGTTHLVVLPDNQKSFEEWLRDHPEPGLAELVERYGGYSRIPPEAWADFDRRMAEWKEVYRRRHEAGVAA